MRAIGVTEFGAPETLRVVELPDPQAGPGEVRIRVHAAAVNPTDTGLRSGARAAMLKDIPPPYVPGMDVAGVVDQIGPQTETDLQLGEHVMGIVVPSGSHGGYSELIVLPAESVARVPAGASDAEAATLPMNGLTVRNALDLLALPAGSTLAVTGSAGIVGQFAIQLGRHEGLTMIGDAAPAEIELIESFGAHRVVPRGEGTEPELREIYPDGVDAILDAALLGPEVIGAVRDGGQLLAVRPYAGEPERDIAIHLVLVGRHLHEGHRIAELADLVTKGVLTLRIAEVLPADHAAEAHRRLAAGGVRGRLVLSF
jgi:NADPH:quinone reductase-like Zn-dependent oxidoreductase